jgi:Carboxypeptidase regulatory-like domain
MRRAIANSVCAVALLAVAPLAQPCWVTPYEMVTVSNRPSGEVFETVSRQVKDEKEKLGFRIEETRKPIAGVAVKLFVTTLPYDFAARESHKRRENSDDAEAITTATSDENGRYSFSDLPIGTYEIVVREKGFDAANAFLVVAGNPELGDKPVHVRLGHGWTCAIVFQPKDTKKQ